MGFFPAAYIGTHWLARQDRHTHWGNMFQSANCCMQKRKKRGGSYGLPSLARTHTHARRSMIVIYLSIIRRRLSPALPFSKSVLEERERERERERDYRIIIHHQPPVTTLFLPPPLKAVAICLVVLPTEVIVLRIASICTRRERALNKRITSWPTKIAGTAVVTFVFQWVQC